MFGCEEQPSGAKALPWCVFPLLNEEERVIHQEASTTDHALGTSDQQLDKQENGLLNEEHLPVLYQETNRVPIRIDRTSTEAYNTSLT